MTYTEEPPIYEIRIKESLSNDRRDWFEGMQLEIQMDGSTLVTGPVTDQPALLGLLNSVSALGLTLVSVNLVKIVFEPKKPKGASER